MSAAAIADPVALVDPTGARRTVTLSPAGHVALFVRALHTPAAAVLHERHGSSGVVEACAVTRGADGRPRPHRSRNRAQFVRLRGRRGAAGAGTDDQGRGTGVLVLGPAAHRTDRWRQGGARRRAAMGRRRYPRHAVAGTGAARAAAGPAARRVGRRRRIPARRAGTSTWPSRAGWTPTNSRPPTLASPSCSAATGSVTAGGSCACPVRATSRADGPDAGVAWLPATCTHPHSTSKRSSAPCPSLHGRPPLHPGTRRDEASCRASTSFGRANGSRCSSPTAPISDYGYARCPLHDDHIPSLKLYDEPRDGWYCWACARGGDLVEYAAWRWHGRAGRDLDAATFRDLFGRLNAELTASRRSDASEPLAG